MIGGDYGEVDVDSADYEFTGEKRFKIVEQSVGDPEVDNNNNFPTENNSTNDFTLNTEEV